MNTKQFIFLIVLAAAIGGTGLILYKRQNQSWSDSGDRLGQTVLADFPLNDVTHVGITSPSGALNLARTEDQWTVQERGGYPADFTQIRDFLRKVWELKVAQPKMVSEAQLDRFDLLLPDKGANAGTLVEFKRADASTIETLRIGKQHMREGPANSPYGGSFPDGRYVMVGDDVNTVALVKDPLNDIETDPTRWLNKDFFKVDGAQTVTVEAGDPTNSWKVARDSRTADWQLVDAAPDERLEKSKVSSLSSVLSSASFTDVVPDAVPDQVGLDKPRTATLETFDGFTYVVQLGATNSSQNYHLKVTVAAKLPTAREAGEDETEEEKTKLDLEWKESNDKLKEKLEQEKKLEKWTYLVSKWTVDALLKQRSDLLSTNAASAEVPFSPLVDPPSKVTSAPVRVPPIEPIIPDPTQPASDLPKTVTPPPPVTVPPLPPTQPEKAPTEPEKAPAEPEKAPAEPEKAPAEPEKAPAEPEKAPAVVD